MQVVADFHIHSKYSRATSRDMDLETISKWAKIKGVKVLGTGDFTHPTWFKELKQKLEPAESGLFKLKPKLNKIKNGDWLPPTNKKEAESVRFILTSEVNCIYSKNDKTRKIHLIIFAPDFKVAEKINTRLSWIGNLKADGRPVLGLEAKELLKLVLSCSNKCLVVPAHIWTPWFGLFGSNFGFDSLSECFEELTPQIWAVETGLDSDPAMNWPVADLNKLTLLSNSDAHSPSRIGREVNLFELKRLNYKNIIEAIHRGPQAGPDESRLASTIELFPEEGKYYYDGHRNCQVVLSPAEARRLNNLCPKCGRPLTVGVLHRLEDLAGSKTNQETSTKIPYKKAVPLEELIADALEVGSTSKAVLEEYKGLIKRVGSEFKILFEADLEEIRQASSFQMSQTIERFRQGLVQIEPGYDGHHGQISLFKPEERRGLLKQSSLF